MIEHSLRIARKAHDPDSDRRAPVASRAHHVEEEAALSKKAGEWSGTTSSFAFRTASKPCLKSDVESACNKWSMRFILSGNTLSKRIHVQLTSWWASDPFGLRWHVICCTKRYGLQCWRRASCVSRSS